MAYLAELLLFFVPFAAYALWRRANPDVTWASGRIVPFVLVGLGLVLAGAVWYGASRNLRRGTAYVPAIMTEDGRIVPGRAVAP